MTDEQALEEHNKLEAMLPPHNGFTPTAFHRKLGMRMAELMNFALGNTDTVDENWELPKEDDENMEDTPSVSSFEENETDEPSYPRIFITCVTSLQRDT